MEWSYSKIKTYLQCPKKFFITYLLSHRDSRGNAFSQFGTFMHEIIEKRLKKKINKRDLLTYYENNFYLNIIDNFPYNKYVNLEDRYYEMGLNYLSNFDGFKGYKIKAIEDKIKFTIKYRKSVYKFYAIVDLILEDKEGNLILVDHKSKSKFKNKKEYEEYLEQLYVYCIAIKHKYGKYPKYLRLNLFSGNGMPDEIFSEKKLRIIIKKVHDTIQLIYKDESFIATSNDFFCGNLCQISSSICEYGV